MAKRKRTVRTRAQIIEHHKAKLAVLQDAVTADNAKQQIKDGKIAEGEVPNLRKLLRQYHSMVKAMKTFKERGMVVLRDDTDKLRVDVLQEIRIAVREGGDAKKPARTRQLGSWSQAASDRLIEKLENLWSHYLDRPGKARLGQVLMQLEAMSGHPAERVRDARSKIRRRAFKYARELGIM